MDVSENSLDRTICSLLARHDEKGMEHLFTRYYKSLVLWAASILDDLPKAEDLVQDFFIKLWTSGGGRELQPKTLKPFLYTSVRNLAYDRVEKKDPLKNAFDIQVFDREWEEYDPLQEELYSLLKREIEQLPERSREVVKCIYWEGLSYKQTADKLGVSVATVNTLLVNSMKKIRQNCSGFKEKYLYLFFMIQNRHWGH